LSNSVGKKDIRGKRGRRCEMKERREARGEDRGAKSV